MAVTTTVEVTEFMENGKICRCTITRHEGLATYTDKDKNQGKPFQAELATFMDYGKQGVIRCYTPPRTPAAEEEKARNRERISEAANAAMRARGIW